MSTKSRATDENSSDSTTKSFLAEHPRMIGVLFMLVLVLTQAGNAAAGSSSIAGP